MPVINIVVGYDSPRDLKSGAKVVYCGYDFAEAKSIVADVSTSSMRRELYRGGLPYISRVFSKVADDSEAIDDSGPVAEAKKAKK